ncbi:S10 family peptidase [Legionella gratiana]|nr:peptidase S10 [Legionella gratiana]
MSFYCILFWVFIYTSSLIAATSDQLTQLPGFGPVKDRQYAGYYTINQSAGLFYWYVEKKKPTSESSIVLWLNGGPGASSLYGFFMENGPYEINSADKLQERIYSWTQVADYLIIDQPAGVGYSYGLSSNYADESQAMDQLYHAVIYFFQKHPDLANKPLYLAGESYAGKYVPQLAIRLLNQKETKLQGLMLGDPWINPRLQQKANIDYAYYHGLIDRRAQIKLKSLYKKCINEIDKHSPTTPKANQICEQMQSYIIKESGGLNLANIYTGKEPDDANMVNYLNNELVRKALHIPSQVPAFKTFSVSAAKKLEIGEQDSVAHLYPQLLSAGIRILIYNGLEDGKDSNFLSTELLISALDWPNKNEFANATTCVWKNNNQINGYAKTAHGLTQVKIRGAGHLAPIDQPERVLNILQNFIKNKPLC